MNHSVLHTIPADFPEMYFRLREKEGRIYTDMETAALPAIESTHAYHDEWQIRKRSSGKLISYLIKKNHPALKILEPGCGNGWLSHRLAAIPGSQVTGLDVNSTELEQARRVFNDNPFLRFIDGDPDSRSLNGKKYDCIILAACVQYFRSIPVLMDRLFALLENTGEIHILDSPFYKTADIPAARERTAAYYRNLGFPRMNKYYFHHSEDSLNTFNYQALYRPSSLPALFSRDRNPFPWFRIKK